MKIAILAVPLVLCACASTQSARWFDASDLKPVKDDNAAGVVLRVSERLTTKAAGKFSKTEFEFHAATQILTQAGVDGAEIFVPEGKDMTTEDLRARSIEPDGTIHELDSKDIKEDTTEFKTRDKERPRSSMKVKVFRVPGVKVGSIVEVGYRSVREGWPSGAELGVAMESGLPIKREDVEVLVNDRIRYAARPYNSDVPVKKDRVGDMTRLSWTLNDIPGRETDEYAPEATQEVPWLAFRVKQLDGGNWAVDVIRNWSDAFRGVADKLMVENDLFDAPGPTSTCADDVRCKIDAAVAEVRKTPLYTRHYWFPSDARAASKILEAKQANPLDKEVLLLDYLRAAGLEARPVAWLEPYTRLQDFDFPAGWFNHMAVYLPTQKGLAKAMWIDPACEECAAGQLTDVMVGAEPWVIQGTKRFEKESDVQVERIRPQGTPPPADEVVATTDMTVDAAGTLKATRVSVDRGVIATTERLNRRDWIESNWKKMGDELAGWIGSTARATKRPTGSCDAAAGTCQTSFEFEAPSYATVAGDQLVVPLTAMTEAWDGTFSAAKRKTGMAFHLPEVRRIVARVHVPAGYRPKDLPPRTELQSPGMQVVVETRQDGDAVVVTRTLQFKPGLYGADSYEAHHKVARAYSAAKDMLLTFARSPAPVTMPQLQ